uniref:Uncharacterized protein n=1 Tax=Rhizophora mucronata TaxID=61149 RepID=A0A2P2IHG3_RHIMU
MKISSMTKSKGFDTHVFLVQPSVIYKECRNPRKGN